MDEALERAIAVYNEVWETWQKAIDAESVVFVRRDAMIAALAEYHQEALDHLGNTLYFIADIHPDERNDAVDEALRFYNKRRPLATVAPSGHSLQSLVDHDAQNVSG